MSNYAEVFDKKQEHLVGKLFRAEKCGNITEIELPEDKNIITVSASDLSVKNVKILNDYVPVFAENKSEFCGQAVMAVFGPDIESVETYIREIKINIEEENISPVTENLDSFVFKYGDVSKYFKNTDRIVSSDSYIDSHCKTLLSAQRIIAKIESGTVFIKDPSQWPLHVRDSVATALQICKDQVYISSEYVHTEYNQLVINPSFAAVITATAARKSGMMCELQVSMSSWQPKSHYHFETELDENNRILAHRATVDIDLGTSPVFLNEICNHIISGLVPQYKTNALEIIINPVKSNTHPISFFADLGYGISFGATENHFNFVLHRLHISPSAWRIENLKEINPLSDRFRKGVDARSISKTVEEAAADSYFERSNSVYDQISVKSRLGRSIMSYSRGIGISCGQGIQGFSNAFPYVPQYGATVTVSGNKKVLIGVGFQMDRHLKRIYREVVQKYFDVDYQDISFEDINNPEITDAGPGVLSRGVGLIAGIIENACKNIKKRMNNGDMFPITERGFYLNTENAPYFESHCSGTIVIDMHLDTVKIVPVIDHVTARIKCGKVFDSDLMSESIRHLISETISEICPYAENLSDIDIKVRSNPNIAAGSCSSLIRGLTSASLTTAISQALSYNIPKIPVSETDLMSILIYQGEHHAAELQD